MVVVSSHMARLIGMDTNTLHPSTPAWHASTTLLIYPIYAAKGVSSKQVFAFKLLWCLGKYWNDTLSWQHDNKTFKETIDVLYKKYQFDELLVDNIEQQIDFYYPIGLCESMEFQTEMTISFMFSNPKYSVYITDPSQAIDLKY